MKLWENAQIVSMSKDSPGLNTIMGGAIITDGDTIVAIGKSEDIKAKNTEILQRITDFIDCEGVLILPGLIDCHTHIVYDGDRSDEFVRRLKGDNYKDINQNGGGILSTVRETRLSSEANLRRLAIERCRKRCSEGVTTLEIKGGYGLNLDSETKMLTVARSLENELPLSIHATFLGAHAIPEEYENFGDDYIDYVSETMLPKMFEAGLVDSVDAFHEKIAFNEDQVRRVFKVARSLELPIRLHADQLCNNNGAQLAAEFGAISADHLEYTDEEGVRKLKNSGTVAVLLPAAFYFLKEKKLPPVNLFRKYGVPMALATDSNPGSAPIDSLLLALNMGCVIFGMTPVEAIAGVTVNAAKALGYSDRGILSPGKRADFVGFDIENIGQLCSHIGSREAALIVKSGNLVFQ